MAIEDRVQSKTTAWSALGLYNVEDATSGAQNTVNRLEEAQLNLYLVWKGCIGSLDAGERDVEMGVALPMVTAESAKGGGSKEIIVKIIPVKIRKD